MSVTIKDVAKRAGVGIGTVSRVLNGGNSVRESTREKVEEAIKALEYTPNQQARRLVTGKSLTIGIIAPFFTSQSVVERLRGIESVIAASPYDLIIYNIENINSLNKYIKQLSRDEKVDGLIVISRGLSCDQIESLDRANTKTIILDAESSALSSVTIDDVAGGFNATKHLINLGHKKIGMVADIFERDLGNDSSRDRFAGYKNALENSGLEFDSDYVLDIGLSRKDGYQMASKILRLPERPSAIVAASDVLASGVIQAAREMSINIPYDLSLIGYDDIELAEFMNLTTIRQPLFDSGRTSAELLLEELNNPEQKQKHIQLPTSVVIRGTTAVAPR
ncbi:MAG: LacI family DNA-binding transcriptional regulator [Chloroflexota bacterium]